MINVNDFNEREFHAFLARYLHSQDIAPMTIYQEQSKNVKRGENEWVHPDMVGFSLPTANWHSHIAHLSTHYDIPKVILYSYELKKEINLATLSEKFFQAVSNSSWANEGYLVAPLIHKDDKKLMDKMSRLSAHFGIGVIELNLDNPEESVVLFQAKQKKDIDTDTINHLHTINKNFQTFFETVHKSLQINTIVGDELDEKLPLDELHQMLYKLDATDDNTSTDFAESPQESESTVIDTNNLEEYDWTSTVTGKKVHSFRMNGEITLISTWRDLYISFCQQLIKQNPDKFKDVALSLKGSKRAYFSNDKDNFRAPYLFNEVSLFAELSISAQLTINIIKNMIELWGYEEDIQIFLDRTA